MKFHAITGMPRSGSTLLCNILNQNPAFYASDSAVTAHMVNQQAHVCSNLGEVKSQLIAQPEVTRKRILDASRGLVNGWYSKEHKKTVFDKSRGWSGQSLKLRQLFPDSVLIVMVRDLRDVFASLEKQHGKYPLLEATPNASNQLAHAQEVFHAQGMVGSCVVGIEDILRRNMGNVIFVSYESFTENPQFVLDAIYDKTKSKPYKHDLENIKNVAKDTDDLWLGKFPHEGCGPIIPIVSDWKKYVAVDVANAIMQAWPTYSKAFGYINA